MGERMIKCVVWDLDETLWEGTLLENDEIRVRPEIVDVIETLDRRGILHSIASRNEPDLAMQHLTDLGLAEYFLAPQIGWNAKSESISRVAEDLNIGVDSLAFVDDQAFEREEVAYTHPEVLCIDAFEALELPDMPGLRRDVVTDEARNRRSMYIADSKRRSLEDSMPPTAFLEDLQMVFTIQHASPEDLARVSELVSRTNQLNSTGETFTMDELDHFRTSDEHSLLVAELEDRFGSYGKIGVAVVEHGAESDIVRILLMSCRIMSRGVGSVLLGYILRRAAERGVPALARFRRTDRNRPMYLAFKMAGFREIDRHNDVALLRHDGTALDPVPSRVRLITP